MIDLDAIEREHKRAREHSNGKSPLSLAESDALLAFAREAREVLTAHASSMTTNDHVYCIACGLPDRHRDYCRLVRLLAQVP